jgi:hypothetical protein
MPAKRPRRDGSGQQHGAAGGKKETLRDRLFDAVNAGVEEAFQEVEEERKQLAEEERKQLVEENTRSIAKTRDAVVKLKADAAIEADEMRRKVQEERAALEEEKAAMEKAHNFQNKKVLLNVGGHRFETSLQTLTSVPATYFASLFSGRFELTLDTEGSYSIDRDGIHFRHILNFLRDAGSFELSSDMTEGQRKELAVELQFYGLLDRMMPYYAQERVGQALLQRACFAGTNHELQTAVAQARVLVFEIGSTTPFLTDEFQDLRFVISDRVVNGSPVWAASSGISELFMFHSVRAGTSKMVVGDAAGCVEGGGSHFISNLTRTGDTGAAPTDLPIDNWTSATRATLGPEYAAAERPKPGYFTAWVPAMRITVVHGLCDGDPTLAAALRQLVALA